MRYSIAARTSLCLLLSALSGNPASAQEVEERVAKWDGPVDGTGNWFAYYESAVFYDYINWNPQVLPNEKTIETRIANGGTAAIRSDDDHADAGKLLLIAGDSAVLLQSGSLTADNERIGGYDPVDDEGTFEQEGGQHTVTESMTILETGTYMLSGGTLTLSSSSGSLINNGIFTHGEKGTLEVAGTMTIGETGTYTLSGGALILRSGNLQNNGTFEYFNPEGAEDHLSTNISGKGKLTKQGPGTLILSGQNTYTGGTEVLGGALQGDTTSLGGNITNNATVVFDQGETGVYEGTISGIGDVVKQNAGLLIFNGQSSYTGGTELLGGALQIGDAAHLDASILGPVSIGADSTLSGHGTIDGDVNNAGTLAPGGSIGTLTVTGDVTFLSDSTFQVAIDPIQSSRLDVGGNASLGGAQVEVAASSGAYGPKRYTIFSAGSLDGRFRDEVVSNFASIDPLLTPSLAYDANNVYLDLDPIPLSDPMATPDATAEDLVYMIARMTTGRFSQAMGELCPARFGFWARGFGMESSASAAGDSPGYDGDASGFVLGFDSQVTDRLSLGIVGFDASIDVTTHTSFTDRSNANVRGFNLYGAYTNGAWQLRSALGYSNESYTSRQTIVGSTQTRRAGSSTEANRLTNYTEGSYTFMSGDFSVQPLLAMQLGWMDRDGFTQEGLFADGQGLAVDGRTQYLADGLAGARARQDLRIGDSTMAQLELRALYMRRFGELEDSVDGILTGGKRLSLTTQDRPESRNAAIVGAGLTVLTTNKLNLYLDYNGAFSEGRRANFFSAGVRYVW